MKEVMTALEAATELGCSTDLVRELARAGELQGRMIGRQWRFLSEAVEAVRPTVEARQEALKATRQGNLKAAHQGYSSRGGSQLCPAGPVPGFDAVLEELGVQPGEFAMLSGISFKAVEKIQAGESVNAVDRSAVLETVVQLRRQKRDNEEAAVREAMR